jgi:hypothetical protein
MHAPCNVHKYYTFEVKKFVTVNNSMSLDTRMNNISHLKIFQVKLIVISRLVIHECRSEISQRKQYKFHEFWLLPRGWISFVVAFNLASYLRQHWLARSTVLEPMNDKTRDYTQLLVLTLYEWEERQGNID